jgi:hypothetical protein
MEVEWKCKCNWIMLQQVRKKSSTVKEEERSNKKNGCV